MRTAAWTHVAQGSMNPSEKAGVAGIKWQVSPMVQVILSNRSANVEGGTMQQGSIGPRAARACVGLGLAAALASGCGEDEADPVPDSVPLGELSPAQLESLCDEILDARANQESASCLPQAVGSTYSVVAQAASACDWVQLGPCDVTAGEVRACERAQRADVCWGRHESTAACAPLMQRGCAAEGISPWTDACPDLAAAVAPFEGIYELSRHSRNDTSCDAEGPSVLETDAQRLFVVVTIMLHGAPIGRLDSCDDLEQCRAVADSLRRYSQRTDLPKVNSDPAESLRTSLLCHPTIEGALESEVASVNSAAEEGRCDLEQTERIITRAQDGTLRLEARSFAWQASGQDGFCSFPGSDPSWHPDVDCSRLEVYEAQLVSAL